MGKTAKLIRRQIRKERNKIAVSIAEEIYSRPFWDRFLIAINIPFKRGV